ncbi:MAG: glycosyltransferase, partial [Vicinamibacteraceae bacterium]
MTEASVHTVQLGKEWFSEQSGGLNRYYADLVRWLPDVGVGVTGLVAGSSHVAARSAGRVRAFAPRQASLTTRLAGVRAHARQVLAERRAGLVVAHFALYAAPCLDLFRGIPLVVQYHGPWAAESQAEGANPLAVRLKHWLEHAVYRRAARFVVLSRAFGAVLDDGHAIGMDRIRVIPGGVDTQRFTPSHTRAEARRLLGWPTDRPIVFVVRRLVRRMGLE